MIKTNAMRELEVARIAFEPIEYDGQNGTIDAVQIANLLHLQPETLFKTLVLQNTEHKNFICVIPGPATLDLKKAAKAFGEKSLEMLPVKQLLPTTGYVHGGCSPIGTKKKLPVIIDELASILDVMYVSGGRIGLTLKIKPTDLQQYTQAKFADITL